jgi:hypothetical protein
MAQVTTTLKISDTAAKRVGLTPEAAVLSPADDATLVRQLAAALMTVMEDTITASHSDPAWSAIHNDVMRRGNNAIDQAECASLYGVGAVEGAAAGKKT